MENQSIPNPKMEIPVDLLLPVHLKEGKADTVEAEDTVEVEVGAAAADTGVVLGLALAEGPEPEEDLEVGEASAAEALEDMVAAVEVVVLVGA